MWIAKDLRHHRTYIDAFNAMVAGWFSNNKYDPLMTMSWHSQLNTTLFEENSTQRQGCFAKTAEEYQKFYNTLYENPLLKFFFSYNTYAVIVPTFVFTTVFNNGKNRKNRYWLIMAPVFFSLLLGCFLAPVSIHFEGRRYLYPLIYTIPILLAFCLYTYKDNQKNYTEK